MRRATRFCLKTILVIAVLWSGLWFAGRLVIEHQIDSQMAALSERGIEVEQTGREIGGFPFGYTAVVTGLRYADPASGTGTALPRIEGRYEVSSPTSFALDLPEKFEVTLPLAEGFPPMTFEVETKGLSVTAEGLPGEAQTFRVKAESLLAIHAAGGAIGIAVEFLDLDLRFEKPASGSPDPARAVVQIGNLDLLTAHDPGEAPKLSLSVLARKLTATASGAFADAPAVARLLAGAGGRLEIGAEIEAGDISLLSTLPEGQARVAAASGIASFVGTLGAGRLELDLQASRTAANFARAGLAGRFDAGVESKSIQARLRGPLSPEPGDAEFSLGLAFLDLAPDAALWDKLDRENEMSRAPGELVVELLGTGRLTRPLHMPGAEEAPLFEVATLDVDKARLTGLGLRVGAEGGLAAPESGAPLEGDVLVRTQGSFELLERLTASELMGRGTAQWLAIWMNMGLMAGSEPGELVSELKLTETGLLVNGLPFGEQREPRGEMSRPEPGSPFLSAPDPNGTAPLLPRAEP